MKPELEKRLMEAARAGNVPDNLLNEIFEEYSHKIFLAVNPLDYPSAPFVISALNSYTKAIEAQFPGAAEASTEMGKKIGSVTFRIPKKGGGAG